MNQYTKGEWKVTTHRPLSNLRIVILGKHPYQDENIAMVEVCPEAKANADLIAAAPDMVGVLRQFVRYCEKWQRSNQAFPNGDGRALILKNARAALAKAEGKE